ncbi:MAG: glycogen debranching protein GlgX [Rhodoblastus sp.]
MDEHDAEDCAQPDGPGLRLCAEGAILGVVSRHAREIWVCLFDEADREFSRIKLGRRSGDLHYGFVRGLLAGQKYGLRADGPWDVQAGHRFDPAKLLVDPMARRLDRPFVFDPALCAARENAHDTARLVPKAIAEARLDALKLAPARTPGLIYEICVRAHTMRDPRVPGALRGTLGGLASPHVIARLTKLGVTHVELMPITAWIDERHLPPLGLANAWGYNPVGFIAPDPRIAPNGLADLRACVAALRAAGIGALIDVVFNHSGESDASGPTLSLRGLDNALYYRHDREGRLINDAGCGNSLDCTQPATIALILDALRLFVLETGVEGFRFDLATSIARRPEGFDAQAPLLAAIAADSVLRGRMLIAEPWDIGPGGYQLGRFPKPWAEWNDRYRDDARRFWRGDASAAGAMATRIAGSADLFRSEGRAPRASVNFIAAHDGFTLRDLVSFSAKRNFANGENNRDGNNGEICWNGDVEGDTGDAAVLARRRADMRALLATLFLSLGTPMLTAGDEFGRTQSGNNNAYAQDNETTWLDWANADSELADFVGGLARLRTTYALLREDRFLSGRADDGAQFPDALWTRADGVNMQDGDWDGADCFALTRAPAGAPGERLHIVFNRGDHAAAINPPPAQQDMVWSLALDSNAGFVGRRLAGERPICPARAVCMLAETRF